MTPEGKVKRRFASCYPVHNLGRRPRQPVCSGTTLPHMASWTGPTLLESSMTTLDALLDDIRANPDDDLPRLALADWCMEQNDLAMQARGEFIHLRCRAATLPLEHRERLDLEHRARLL